MVEELSLTDVVTGLNKEQRECLYFVVGHIVTTNSCELLDDDLFHHHTVGSVMSTLTPEQKAAFKELLYKAVDSLFE